MKKLILVLFAIFCMPLSLCGQVPRPYLLAGVDLMPGGYAPLAVQGGGGIEWETRYSVFDSYAGYDNGRKENDNTPNNYKGHDRFLRGFAGIKYNLWYAGVGARWSQLSTTNYTKGGSPLNSNSWHPELGIGRDWNAKTSPLFMRTQVLYMFREQKEVTYYPNGTTCDGCGNGTQGVDISLWFPSPAKPGHWFCKMNFVLFGYHDSITDPSNLVLTQTQKASGHFSDSTEFAMGYRF
jgi:hypothetical protein